MERKYALNAYTAVFASTGHSVLKIVEVCIIILFVQLYNELVSAHISVIAVADRKAYRYVAVRSRCICRYCKRICTALVCNCL